MAIKCTSCGADVSDYDKECSYCGTANPDYRSPEREITVMMSDGIEAFRSEQYTAAIRHFLDVIDLAPEMFDAYFYLSACHSALNRPEEALKAMEQAQRIRPGSAPLYYNLGVLCQKVGRKEEAKKYLEQALVTARTDPRLQDVKEFEKRVKKELRAITQHKRFLAFKWG